MTRYKITLSYDGSNFAGFQVQPNLRTVQGEIERALSYINQQRKTTFVAAGRTDRKVHAKGQVGHCDFHIEIPPYKLKRAINSNTDDDLYVVHVEKVDERFHARFSKHKKTYIYRINLGEYQPMERNYIYQYNHNLDVESMQKAISFLLGTHDFRAFVSENEEKENCIRTIYQASITRSLENPNILQILFEGNGFLKYQIRNMVGYLIKVGEKKASPDEIQQVLTSKDRTKAGKRAPAQGLCLEKIEYEEEI